MDRVEAGCENCDWRERFESYSNGKYACVMHDCGNPQAWIKQLRMEGME